MCHFLIHIILNIKKMWLKKGFLVTQHFEITKKNIYKKNICILILKCKILSGATGYIFFSFF